MSALTAAALLGVACSGATTAPVTLPPSTTRSPPSAACVEARITAAEADQALRAARAAAFAAAYDDQEKLQAQYRDAQKASDRSRAAVHDSC
ncbi:hypothetical protein [Candidatus Poriferisodalis sp.]|uniref:hypothetical protein n=1 Tax=Candidatus Poriferisodalis sp. TaxID=3101277 RepID=UPI003B017F81